MSPDLDLRLRTMIATMDDVISPAIDKSNKLAVEQAGLLVGSLKMIMAQIDYSHPFEVVELRDFLVLAGEISAKFADGGEVAKPALADAEAALAEPIVSTLRLRNANRVLREVIRVLLEDSAGLAKDAQAAIQRAILKHSKASIARERTWVAGTGFEVLPEPMRSIPNSLGIELTGETA